MTDYTDAFELTVDRINENQPTEVYDLIARKFLESFETRNREEFTRGAISMAMFLSFNGDYENYQQDSLVDISSALAHKLRRKYKRVNWKRDDED